MEQTPVDLRVLRATPNSRDITFRAALGACQHELDVRIQRQTATAVYVTAMATTENTGSVSAVVDGQVVHGSSCQAIATASPVVVRLAVPLGHRKIVVNGEPAQPASN
jgi:hypothetical protein